MTRNGPDGFGFPEDNVNHFPFSSHIVMNTRTARLILPSRSNKPKRVYVFVVTALAVFLVGLAIWRIPVAGYTSQVIIGYDTGHQGKGQEPYKGEVERVLSSLGTYKLKKISTVVHAPWCLGDLRHYTNHKQLFSKWK